jgi:hypothetical protein
MPLGFGVVAAAGDGVGVAEALALVVLAAAALALVVLAAADLVLESAATAASTFAVAGVMELVQAHPLSKSAYVTPTGALG